MNSAEFFLKLLRILQVLQNEGSTVYLELTAYITLACTSGILNLYLCFYVFSKRRHYTNIAMIFILYTMCTTIYCFSSAFGLLATTLPELKWWTFDYLVGLTPPDIDPVPMVLWASSLLYVWSISSSRLFMIMPVAKDAVFHCINDGVLVHVVQACQTLLQAGELFARYGGEEFVFARKSCTAAEGEALANRLLVVAAQPLATSAGIISVTVSLGVAEARNGAEETLPQLLNKADQALYAAKEQ